TEELFFCMLIPRSPITADADSDRTRAASLALRLPHRVQNALAHAVQIASGTSQMRELNRHRVLNVFVFATAALEQQFYFDFVVVIPLMKMDDRCAGSQVVAGVLTGNRIDRVWSQLAEPGSFRDSLSDLATHHNLISADWCLDFERRHPGVLA